MKNVKKGKLKRVLIVPNRVKKKFFQNVEMDKRTRKRSVMI